jgi:hypothetical protein
VSFPIPVEIEDSEAGTTKNTMQGSNREAKVISVAQAVVRNSISFDEHLIAIDQYIWKFVKLQ